MKKTVRKKARVSTKTSKRIVRRAHKQTAPAFSVHRIIFFSGLFLVMLGFLFSYKNPANNSVLGASIVRPLYSKAIISIPSVPGATSYNLYYKASTDTNFVYAVRNISPTTSTYTINYLKAGTRYFYKIAALKGNTETWFSQVLQMISQSM